MHVRTTVMAAWLVVLAGCGPLSEEELIGDDELSSLVSERQSMTSEVSQQPAAAPAFYVRLAWGYLAGNRSASSWLSWSGKASADGGAKVSLSHLIYFDRHDRPVPSTGPGEVSWRSRTLPHFDGLVLKVEPTVASTSLTFATPPYSRTLAVADLAVGLNEHVVVDAAGHEVSISSVPAKGCGGFALGYERAAPAGWLGFAGLVTDETGAITGRLRFRSDGGQLQARLIAADGSQPYRLNVKGEVVATGEGELDEATGAFELRLVKPDGSSAGKVRGLFVAPSYSPRGTFQAVVDCP